MKTAKKGGRPTKSDSQILKYRVVVKLCTVDYYTLKSKAKAARLTVSDFIRTTLHKCEVKERLTATHLQLITKLTGMANNLNQIAKRANQAGYFSAKTESETLAKEIDNVIKSIENDG